MAPRRSSRVSPDDSPRPARLERLAGPRSLLRLRSDSPERTLEIGRVLGSLLPAGTALSLEGGLGAGKTLLMKGISAGLGVPDEVTSPSFVLAEEYRGEFPVLHFDLYRLARVDDAAGIGLFDAVDGRAVVIVEWGDRLPPGAMRFDAVASLRIAGPESRDIVVAGPKELCDELERNL
jgi:tRNA threonylcarbamoyladenosine biosynthesis protein TsaE